MATKRQDNLAGVPLRYDRDPASNYGRTGFLYNPFFDTNFVPKCDAAFAELFALFDAKDVGPVTSILSGGVGRSGNGSSYHHRNRAFDLDGLMMDDGNWVADTFPQRPHMYLAIESVLRRHFGTVLSYDYNAAHEDHFHFDDGRGPGFKTLAKSHVIYLQNVLVFVWDIPVGRDGVWGPQTNGAATDLRRDLNIGPFSTLTNWMQFLAITADAAMDRELSIPAVDEDAIASGGGG